ncbi:Response regulator receiver domain-containing protein [Marivirga sericea]|uniref:Response regulator receiver domain-containing protein n=1 Tax=Marivirga sericea TaxID=1028 RepID=A0A1X7IED4_9BACT|nr:response regulator [Marivirga sericea]SMG12661.1 Response regulator receiver domain-containing protein [Marivirga sericea]
MAVFKNVCIVDDDDLFMILTIDIMKDENFAENIYDFDDGKKALSYLKSTDEHNFPEVLFLDINMPMMDGWEFMDVLKEDNLTGKMNIYITSSSIDPIDLKKAEENPFIRGFLTKPLDPEKLKTVLKN